MDVFEYNNIKIYNGDCVEVANKIIPDNSIDLVMTSPPYNTAGGASSARYDGYYDNRKNSDYYDFTVKLFKGFERILKKNGCVLYNMSYGSENTACMLGAVNEIINKTDFVLADIIIWKKTTAMPVLSANKLTRICEFIYVFCRESEFDTFYTNKAATSVSASGQTNYGVIYNYVEAANNDGSCDLNKATYSTELCDKMFNIYAPDKAVIYDPFMGTGTTAVAAMKRGYSCYGSELSTDQCIYAIDRLKHSIENLDFGGLF